MLRKHNLYEWEAEAERLTADSYATEAEDTFVNLVTSDGDGTFTYTPTTDYSALHRAAKAATFNPAIYAPLASPALTGTPTAPTASGATNTTQLATTAQVHSAITADVGVANSAVVKTALNASGTAPIYACRAWVNFNGTGTVAINASGNVSSITDNGVGNYTANCIDAMPDANYSYTGGCNYTTTTLAGGVTRNSTDIKTTSAIQFHSVNVGGLTAIDTTDITIAIFR